MNTLYVASKLKLVNEMYFAILLDRTTSGETDLHPYRTLRSAHVACHWASGTAPGTRRGACHQGVIVPHTFTDLSGICIWQACC